MDDNTRAVLVAAMPVIGALGGVYIGFWLQEEAARRREREGVYDDLAAAALSVIAYLSELEVFMTMPRGSIPEPRDPDSVSLFVRLIPRLTRASAWIKHTASQLEDAVKVATGSLGVTAPERSVQRTAIVDALGRLMREAEWDLNAHWWERLRRDRFGHDPFPPEDTKA